MADFFEKCLLGLVVFIGLFVGVILCAMLYEGWQQANSPVIEIYKNEWECVATKTTSGLMPQQAGKVTVMIPSKNTVCVQYKRK